MTPCYLCLWVVQRGWGGFIDKKMFLFAETKLSKMKYLSFILGLLVTFNLAAQKYKPAYKVFTDEGKKADYGDIIKEVKKADVVFFGELPDNPIAHWMELEITKDLFSEKGENLVLAAEMFEPDNQILIDKYFVG